MNKFCENLAIMLNMQCVWGTFDIGHINAGVIGCSRRKASRMHVSG